MFSTIFKCVNQAVLIGRRGALQIQTRELIKSIRILNFTKRPWLEMTKEDTVHIKNMHFTENIQM